MNVSKKIQWMIVALIEIPFFAGIFLLGQPYNLYTLMVFVAIPYLFILLNL